MPGRGNREVDTSSWGVNEWRSEQRRNLCFLIAWTAFFAKCIADSLQDGASLGLAFMLFMGIVGFFYQTVWLIRLTNWLRQQEISGESHDSDEAPW